MSGGPGWQGAGVSEAPGLCEGDRDRLCLPAGIGSNVTRIELGQKEGLDGKRQAKDDHERPPGSPGEPVE
jgi:hypothetical protein